MTAALVAFLLYTIAFFLLHPRMGGGVAALSILPVLLSGWALGIRAGLAAGVLTIVLNTLLLNLAGEGGWDVVWRIGGGPGSLTLILGGAGAGWVRNLHRRYQEEIAARKLSEEHFRTLFEESPLGMSLVDAENRFVRVNSRLCEMLGYSAESLTKLSFTDITHPEDLQADLEHAKRLRAGEIPRFNMEKRYIRQDGTLLWVHLTVTTIHDARDGAQYYLGMVEDIDERKQAELALQRRDRILEAVAYAAQTLLHSQSWEEEIDAVLARLGEVAKASSVLVLQNQPDPEHAVRCRSQWMADDVAPASVTPPENRPSPEAFTRWTETLGRGEAVVGRREQFAVPLQEMLAAQGVEALALLPIFVGERNWGQIAFERRTLSPEWTGPEIEALKVAASTLGAVIYRTETEAQVHQRNRELQLLNRVVVAATSELEPFAVLETACRELAQAFSLPQAGAALLDDSGEALEVVAEYRTGAGVSALGERIPLAGNVATEIVMREKRPLIVQDAQRDPRMTPVHQLMRRRNVASMLLLPLEVDGQVVGTLGLDAAKPRAFSEEDVRLAATVTAASAQVLEKAELLQRTEEQAAQLAALRDVQLAISSSLEPKVVYEAIVRHAARLVPSSGVCLFRWDGQTNERLAHYGKAADPSDVVHSLDEGLLPERLDEAGSFVIPRRDGEKHRWASLLVPLRYRERATGFLAFHEAEGGHAWVEEEIALAESLAAQAAITVANTRLHAQTKADAETVRQILNTIPDGVVLLDAEHKIITANRRGRTYLDWLTEGESPTLEELGGKSLSAFLAPPPSDQAGHEVRLEANGKRVFEVRAATAPAGWVLAIRDVTRDREQQQQLQAQERLAAVGQLSAGIAHDFNNILAVIILHAEMMSTEALPPKVEQRLDTVYEQAQRASELVQQILDFGRKAVMRRREFDLLPFLREQVTLLRRTLPATIDIELTHESGSYIVDADSTRLQQALMNLALNARDAMKDGGSLHLDLSRPEGSVQLPDANMVGEEWIRLDVSDCGTGIEPEHLAHVFEPFYTTKAPGDGSGLGLAQVYGIVRQHEGHVEVKSTVGRGTTFTLYLPAVERAAPSPEPLEQPPAHAAQQRILVVEDNPMIRDAIAEILGKQGYDVQTAEDGAAAIDLLKANGDDVELVISDMVMPQMGGKALFHALKAHNPDVRMVLISGYPLDEESQQFVDESGSVWVQKPFTQEQLLSAIRHSLAT
ncbi:MAG: PAS domain S-box protein [Candidatus Promineifilaceae bacterium]|nr:PAS domain S-box protein [Candidatus Promineifilaceae bacterium]